MDGFDVNEGDAMLLTCGGKSMPVGCGPNQSREHLRDELTSRNLTHFKYVFSTHYHEDLIDGNYRLLTYGFTADEYLHGYSDWAISQENRMIRTVNAAQGNGIPIQRVQNGDSLTLG